MLRVPTAFIRKTRRFVPRLGELETRLTPSVTVTVNITNDTNAVSPASSPNDSTGHVSLRSAVEYVNHQASSFASPNVINLDGLLDGDHRREVGGARTPAEHFIDLVEGYTAVLLGGQSGQRVDLGNLAFQTAKGLAGEQLIDAAPPGVVVTRR